MTILSNSATPYRSASHLWDLILVLVQKEMKVRYKNSWLGYAWSVANPLLFSAVYYVALGVFLRFEVPGYPYPLFLIAGQFPWQWLSTSVGSAPVMFIYNASLIKKVRFPRNILVASNVLSDAVHFLLTIPVITLGVLWYGFMDRLYLDRELARRMGERGAQRLGELGISWDRVVEKLLA